MPWWRDAVVYEIYVRSFADGNGDGVGDLPGIRARLPYLADLGVDAVWLTPFYRSPMADGGYDVADYRDVDPLFGDLRDFDALVAEAHRLGLRVIVDVVPNHSSSEHPWFKQALAAGPGSPERERYIFRPGSPEPPNDWRSVFGGPAWSRSPDGEWYLHLFAPEQPDFNWRNPEVHEEFAQVLRFWLDRGVDGFRIDVAMGLYKRQGLPSVGDPALMSRHSGLPFWGQPETHGVYRDWRRVLDSYEGDRVAVGEVWTDSAEDLARYVRPDELHQTFNFRWLEAPWSAEASRRIITETLDEVPSPTWVLSNHDVVRHLSRYGNAARARAALLAMLSLPGSAYLYQGEELGLPEVKDLPPEARQDPIFERSKGELAGRDGCRVPLPWSGAEPPFGFSPAGVAPWLPQPAAWSALTAEAQATDPGSTLSFYRRALALRRAFRDRLPDGIRWLDTGDEDLLAFTRGDLTCAVNYGSHPAPLPPGAPVLTSAPVPAATLPPDTAAWLATGDLATALSRPGSP
ncbi:glycoside hydrolase family 13 protein [Bailinhaonella thermotolerans]|uniref:Glycoside hydrolase family 13 protein n=1 Tax=Bailinhaonella thermotolerans TaxID=1070861 RepID=A0A3A4AN49_9ACTN|nr:glycoside hydrolase family 13 protein [Bailinhaonella thermotolerans]RJL22778.1 glycoside hydrolase family 13 protein [Bailinhaonella thermotolerans]